LLIAAAAAQQVQSELAVRVSSWRSRIDPILAAEEDRSAFDIHDYGSKILTRLQDTKQQPEDGTAAAAAEAAAKEAAAQLEQQQQNDAAGGEPEIVDFKQVAGASDSFEVCRLFAAMLQLVNNRWGRRRAGGNGEGQGKEGMQGNCQQQGQATVDRLHMRCLEGSKTVAADGSSGQRRHGVCWLSVYMAHVGSPRADTLIIWVSAFHQRWWLDPPVALHSLFILLW
jgi:hypothetical protein